MITPELAAKFWQKVEQRGPDECWPWLGGAIKRDGRGYFWLSRRVRVLAPRFALVLNGIDVPDDRHACHHCDNPNCVNPAHLFVGTNRDNMLDASAKGRLKRPPQTHCVRGHPLTGNNVAMRDNGNHVYRQCVACTQLHCREYRARKAAFLVPADARSDKGQT